MTPKSRPFLTWATMILIVLAGCQGAGKLTPSPSETAVPNPTEALPATQLPTPTLEATETPKASESLGPDEQPGASRTRPTDGMTIVYVPAGTFSMGSDESDTRAQPVEFPAHAVTLDAFWIDQTEVPNESYAQCVEAGACRKSKYANNPAYNKASWPAVGVSWRNAADYCTWAGGRLPTEAEWEYAARGDQGSHYPWGDEWDGRRANTCDAKCTESWADASVDDGHAESSPVGSFSEGASWVGALDMAGNVWEWVWDWNGNYTSASQINPAGPAVGNTKVIRGGCWASPAEGVRTAYRLEDNGEIVPSIRHPNIGFRCMISATTPLPTETLDIGDTRRRPADEMEMVYLPTGAFQMGSTAAEIATALSLYEQYPIQPNKCVLSNFEVESPQHLATLDGFWLDRTEVTNAQYLLCVEAGSCRPTRLVNDSRHNGDDLPVAGVPWADAANYCAWAGGRLPTEAEWEYAARGPQSKTFPWGDDFDCAGGNLYDPNTNCDDGYPGPSPVGSFPAGANWCGALDMAGNVWEWVADPFAEYPAEDQVNPTPAGSGEMRILRGGSWGYTPAFTRTAYRYPAPPEADYLAVGFRCMVSLEE